MTRTPLSRRGFLGATALGAGAVLIGAGPAHADRARHTVALRARPDAESERLRLQQALRTTDFNSTGVYLPAGATLTVRVEAVDGVLPTLYVGAPDTHPDVTYKNPRRHPLTAGLNTVGDAGGGMVYLALTGDGERARVKFLDGGRLVPRFVLGETTESDFQAQLDARADVPQAELVSPRGIVTVTREGLLLWREQDHAAHLRLLETIIDSHAAISGLSAAERSPLGFHLVEAPRMPTGAGAYATHGWTAYPRTYLDRLLTVEGLRTRGWGVYHELGHQHQQMAYKPTDLTEVTVNVYSLAAQRTLGQPSNLTKPDTKTGLTPYQSALAKLPRQGQDYVKAFGAFEKLVPLRQLELAFGDGFWPELHRLVRAENPPSDWTESAKRWGYLALYTSRTSGRDLTGFWARWGAPLTAEYLAQVAALNLPAPTTDPSTLSE
ncbi:twin-arginine translocation signal domain-containing protein [Nonomuraea sp. NN258]|uniref:M60 family metallopeptidase n=1 Tax=Nonomuraea antri TaxID=2730852 RepID=UPI001567C9E2|nr:M60 family metallopeptidase [Nonomuraea antri]NRQ35580.1 twin-arginine translocation signal domain-containing protein [Nonomuraea antri]